MDQELPHRLRPWSRNVDLIVFHDIHNAEEAVTNLQKLTCFSIQVYLLFQPLIFVPNDKPYQLYFRLHHHMSCKNKRDPLGPLDHRPQDVAQEDREVPDLLLAR